MTLNRNSMIILWAPALLILGYFLLMLFDVQKEAFLLINQLPFNRMTDIIWAHITELGNGALVGLVALIATMRSNLQTKRLIITTLLTGAGVYALKAFFDAPRPAAILSTNNFHIIGDTLTAYSFPSGHTITAFSVAGLLLFQRFSLSTKTIVAVLAILAGISRVVVGAHWLEDILIGAAIGLLISGFTVYCVNKPFNDLTASCVKTFLAFFTLAGNLTLANDFPDIASVNFIRFAFLILSTIMTVYFFLECFQVTHKVGKHLRPRLVQLVRSKQALVIRFSKFGLVGGVGFGVDTFFYLFIQFLGADHSTARFISYWCAATNNWFLNRIFTFKDKDKDHHGTQWLKYMMMCGVSFILNGGTYFLLTSYIDFFSEYKFLAFMIGIGFGMTTNFTISHLIIFKNRGK